MGEDPKFLESQSPIHKADKIRAPLLIAHGANDPRVKQQESDQIVDALRKNRIHVTYMVFENEGHGFAEPENVKRFAALTEKFLADTLGGRVQPLAESESVELLLR
jgi:dipeptidyl aminopeptidase/acylaminoacyl peptidase